MIYFGYMSLLHIRIGKELKKQVQKLIDVGLFSNQAEVAREAIRDLLLKYQNRLKEIENEKKKQK